MKKRVSLVFFLLAFIAVAFSQFSPGYYALKNVSMIDVVSKKVVDHYTIIIHGKFIEAIGPVSEIKIPDSAAVFNYTGSYVMPGLIDTHVHLATDPSGDDNRNRAERDLKEMLLSGITTVRDMAGDARALASLSRDALTGDIISPDIYYAALMSGPGFFSDPRTQMTTRGGAAGEMPFMKAVTDSTDLRIAIAEAKGTGATAINLYDELNGALVKKITDEAHRQHMLVWSHAFLTGSSLTDVVNAGVNSVSHAGMIGYWPSGKIPDEWAKPGLSESFWDNALKSLSGDAYIKAMLLNKTILDATVITYKVGAADTSIPATRRLKLLAQYQIGRRLTKLALEMGVPVSTGTDLDEQKFVQREIKLLVKECGFTPMDALVSATRNGALAIGIEKTTGVIQPGKVANLLLLSANPATDIDNLDKVTLVIKNGRLFNAAKSSLK